MPPKKAQLESDLESKSIPRRGRKSGQRGKKAGKVTSAPTRRQGIQAGVISSKRTKPTSRSDSETRALRKEKLLEERRQRKAERQPREKRLEPDVRAAIKVIDMIEKVALKKDEKEIEVFFQPDRGNGIKTTKALQKGEYVVEFIGELISRREGLNREFENPEIQASAIYFSHEGRQLCMDATHQTTGKGRLVNHSQRPNLMAEVMVVYNVIRLGFFAARDIAENEELLLDYSDRRKDAVEGNPWLRTPRRVPKSD